MIPPRYNMKILISNDDGIHAPGIQALYEALSPLGEVTVCAPLTQQSAVGHAITISDPIRVEEVFKDGAFFGYGVTGTPADSVKIAYDSIFDDPPDLVVSGINQGPNTGIAILYSGTVSAATEGAILGIPSMAISMGSFDAIHWETGAAVAVRLAANFDTSKLPPKTTLNVNVPNLPLEETKGYKLARMGESQFEDTFHKRQDPHGRTYFWMDGELRAQDEHPMNDVTLLREGYITLTPIGVDLTRDDVFPTLESWMPELRRSDTPVRRDHKDGHSCPTRS